MQSILQSNIVTKNGLKIFDFKQSCINSIFDKMLNIHVLQIPSTLVKNIDNILFQGIVTYV